MTLNHDKVRAILARLERDGQPDACDHDCDERCDECTPLHDTQTLCEEWLAARTARVIHCGVHGFALDAGSGERLAWVEVAPGYWWGVCGATDTGWRADGDPCAWLEAKAREAGYEIEGGA